VNISEIVYFILVLLGKKTPSFEVTRSAEPPALKPEPEPMRQPPQCGWSKSLDDCHPKIVSAYKTIAPKFEARYPDCHLRVDYTYRSPQFQFGLFKKGRDYVDGKWVVTDKSKVVTQKDGVTEPGHHNVYPSQAADILIVRNEKIIWGNNPSDPTESQLYEDLGRMFEAEGLVAGAIWKYNWKDIDHVQVAYEIV